MKLRSKNLYDLIRGDPYLSVAIDTCGLPSKLTIKGISANSKLCHEDFLFAAVSKALSSMHDGHDFIDDAINHGAASVLVGKPTPASFKPRLPHIAAADSKLALCHLAEAFYDYPSRKLAVVGITGTNGKTSTSFMLHSILKQAGLKPKIMGTLGVGDPGELAPTTHTTLEPEFLSANLHKFHDEGATHVIMEVTSHALALNRVEAMTFKAVALTNITQDHLDFHGSFLHYQNAKARLFHELADAFTAVCLPKQHPFGSAIEERNNLFLFGKNARDINYSDVTSTENCTQFTINIFAKKYKISLPFLGHFHVENACTAAALAISLGIDPEAVALGLTACLIVPGRLEPVVNQKGLRVFIDFAHTPDGLASLLQTVKQLSPKKIILVFGCGGNRDQEKRAIMGRIAKDYADIVVVTDDNPRHEPPHLIRRQILDGIIDKSMVTEIADRKLAIRYGIENAGHNDIVVIAGKGHEKYQIYGDEKIDFSDFNEAKKVLEL